MAQVGTDRNTSNRSVNKSRNWCFTLNNYDSKDIDTLTQCKFQYIFQEEKGEEGTPHLQGLLCSNNAISFNSIKKLLPRAHIEKCKNKNASINYCKKGESRFGKIYTNVSLWMDDDCKDTNHKLPLPGKEWNDWVEEKLQLELKSKELIEALSSFVAQSPPSFLMDEEDIV